MKITVTKKHIAKGRKESPDGCPVALAIKGSFPKRVNVGVGRTDVVIDNRSYDLPAKAKSFIGKFDDGKTVKPFSFVLKGV